MQGLGRRALPRPLCASLLTAPKPSVCPHCAQKKPKPTQAHRAPATSCTTRLPLLSTHLPAVPAHQAGPTSRPFHLLDLRPGMHVPLPGCGPCSSFRSHAKCHLLREAFLGLSEIPFFPNHQFSLLDLCTDLSVSPTGLDAELAGLVHCSVRRTQQNPAQSRHGRCVHWITKWMTFFSNASTI